MNLLSGNGWISCKGFVEEGGGEFIDLGTGGLITGFKAISLIASLAISGVNQLRFAFSI
jgi:hypothetical protein